jgi:hypothetical protein
MKRSTQGESKDHNENRGVPEGLFGNFLRWLEKQLFQADDAKASARGWEVRATRRGFGRVYRDPRWNSVFECLSCLGSGADPAEADGCVECRGTGVVRLGGLSSRRLPSVVGDRPGGTS